MNSDTSDTSLLWVQHHVRSGNLQLEKIRGTQNPSDSLTKYLRGPDIRGHLERMSLCFRDGRPESAPQLTTALTTSLVDSSWVLRKENAIEHVKLQSEPPSVNEVRAVSHQACDECKSLQPVGTSWCRVCEGPLQSSGAPLAPCGARKTCPSLGAV